MHTVMVIAGGLALLAVMVFAGPLLRLSRQRAAKWFIPFWLACALINMAIGVLHAGYTVAQDLPIFLVVFAVPAAIAIFTARKS